VIDGELDLPRDESGRVVGYGVGKEAALREWVQAKEKRAEKALFARLMARRYQKRIRAEGGERHRRMLDRSAKWQRDNPEKVNAKTRRHRAKKYRANPIVYRCDACGSTWCKAPWVRQHRKNYCSRACKARVEYHARKALR
jgi:hypothetical protein